ITPYIVLNEGAQSEKGRADAMGKSDNDFTSKNIRPDIYFAKKGKVIYVYARSWKENNLKLKNLAKSEVNIKSVSMLGSKEKLKWQQDTDGLQVALPKKLPIAVPVYVFEVRI
ncbi:MAG: hypothetical protein EOO07_31140, partial [Chitinophagaceae bacterium]